MPSIGDVGDALWRAYEQVEGAARSAQQAASVAQEVEARLNIVLDGSSSPEADEGLTQLRQAREVVEAAVGLTRGGQATLATYICSITVRGPGGTRRHPDGAYRSPDGKYAGVSSAGRSGSDAEVQAHRRLKSRGLEVDERQQHCVTPEAITGKVSSGPRKGVITLPPGTVRRYDGAVKLRGRWHGIEAKGGTASKTPHQRIIDDWLKRPGNTLATADGRILEGVLEMRIQY
jgi:hypothetical protein